jgi:uncharacterized membrane protein
MVYDDRTWGQKVSDGVTRFVGSWKFIILFAMLLGAWMAFNSIAFFTNLRYDPYPFILLNLVLSFVAAFQAPFIMMSQNRGEAKQDAAYRGLFQEIKELVHRSIDIEEKIMEMIKIDHDDEVKYRQQLSDLTHTIKEMVEDDHKDEVKYRTELAELTKAIKHMVEIDHSDEVQYKVEISQLTTAMGEVRQILRRVTSEDEGSKTT